MFVVQPTNLEEYIRLYQNSLPGLKVVLDLHEQVFFWVEKNKKAESELAGVNART